MFIKIKPIKKVNLHTKDCSTLFQGRRQGGGHLWAVPPESLCPPFPSFPLLAERVRKWTLNRKKNAHTKAIARFRERQQLHAITDFMDPPPQSWFVPPIRNWNAPRLRCPDAGSLEWVFVLRFYHCIRIHSLLYTVGGGLFSYGLISFSS